MNIYKMHIFYQVLSLANIKYIIPSIINSLLKGQTRKLSITTIANLARKHDASVFEEIVKGYLRDNKNITRDRIGCNLLYLGKNLNHDWLGDHAIKVLELALLYLKNEKTLIDCLVEVATSCKRVGFCRKAIEYYKLALHIAKKRRLSQIASSCYESLGTCYFHLSDFEKALKNQQKALVLAKKIGSREIESRCYCNIGMIYTSYRNYKKSFEYQRKALVLAKKIGSREIESRCYSNLGREYFYLLKYQRALSYYRRGLKIAKTVAEMNVQSICYANLGLTFYSLNDDQKSLYYLDKALQVSQDIQDRRVQYICHLSYGLLYQRISKYQEAIPYYKTALKMVTEIEDKIGECTCNLNLGVVFDNLSNYQEAIGYYERALEIAKKIRDKRLEATSYISLGYACNSTSNVDKAILYLRRALQMTKKLNDRAGAARSYVFLGDAYRSLFKYKISIDCYNAALAITKESEMKSIESNCYINLGMIYYNLQDYQKSLFFSNRALSIKKKIGDLHGQSLSNKTLGASYIEVKKLNKAFIHLKESIRLSETIGSSVIQEKNKIGYYGISSNAYEYIIGLCLQTNRYSDALDYAERSRSKALLDVLKKTDIASSILIPENKKRLLNPLLKEENTLNKEILEIQNSPSIRIGKIMNDLLLRREKLYKKMKPIIPQYVSLRTAKPLALEEIQELLTDEAILVEYYVAQNKIFIFIVESNNLHAKTVEITEEKFFNCLMSYEKEVQYYPEHKKSGKTFTNDWQDLGRYLIDPISEYISHNKLICFVPHGMLHYFPLHALSVDGEYLIKKHTVSYSPSASLLQFYTSTGSGVLRRGAVFGVDFAEEAKDVTNILNGKLCLNASKKQVLQNLNNDILHFSCHGYFDKGNPLASGVQLKDSNLTAEEIFDLRINTELVTLSACQTGISENEPGDELIGLSRAFVYAGVPSLVVSLWDVSSYTTRELMIDFYTNLKNGDQKAIALQNAQINIMERHEHPFFWAPFILIGDWKLR
jgi:CHAT domain-containing protein/Tfp pilus assembly protein PilF